MSLSLNSFARPNLREVAGLYIGRRQLSAVLLSRDKGAWKEVSSQVVELTEPLFERVPTPSNDVELIQALRTVSADFSTRFVPLSIAVPDAAVRCSILELDAIPPNNRMFQELLSWRLSKDIQRPEEAVSCFGQYLGSDHGKHLVYSQAIDRSWLDCLTASLKSAALMPWSLNSASCYRYNCHHDTLASSGGALISIDSDCWGFQLWDGDKRVRYVRSRWRDSSFNCEKIAEEVERSIRAHSHSQDGYQIEQLYISGNCGEVESLRHIFNQKLHTSVSKLDVDVLPVNSVDTQHEAALLLARTAAAGYENNN